MKYIFFILLSIWTIGASAQCNIQTPKFPPQTIDAPYYQTLWSETWTSGQVPIDKKENFYIAGVVSHTTTDTVYVKYEINTGSCEIKIPVTPDNTFELTVFIKDSLTTSSWGWGQNNNYFGSNWAQYGTCTFTGSPSIMTSASIRVRGKFDLLNAFMEICN